MKTKHIYLVIVAFTLVGCSTSYTISKKSKLYQTEVNGISYDTREYDVNKTKVTITEKDDHVIVNGVPNTLNPTSTTTTQGTISDYRGDLQGNQAEAKYYYPDPRAKPDKSLIYYSWNLNLSAATISIKNRFKIRPLSDPTVQDSFPSTFSTGFSPTFTLGANRSIHWVTPSAKKYELGFTLGGFYGFGTTKIDKNTTRDTPYQYSRTALYHSFGGFFNVGFQKFDVGLAFGWDIATGPGSPSWVYQGQPFYGIILGYDIVKFKK